MSVAFIVLAAALSTAGAATLKRVSHQKVDEQRGSSLRGRGSASSGFAPMAVPQQEAEVTARLKLDYPYYHTSDELLAALEELKTNCDGADFEEMSIADEENDQVSIQVYSVKAKGSKPVNKVFFLSGEHARELIGSESTLRLLQALCGADGGGVEKRTKLSVADVLKDNEFRVVVNGNPRSRTKVEQGDFCVRANPEGVDLNRNWDEEWNAEMTIVTNSGKKPFSEPETRIVKKMVEEFEPSTFVSVHSGTLGMYMPWAWSPDYLAGRNQEGMMDVLRAVDATHCQCPFGAAGKEVGYPCPGTSVDWVFDKLKAPYSFAFEIWGAPEEAEVLKDRWRQKMEDGGEALLQMGARLTHAHFSEVFSNRTRHRSDFALTAEEAIGSAEAVQRNIAAEANMRASDTCFHTFNPVTEELYSDAVENWASAYLEMANMIGKELRKNQTKK